MAFSVGKTGRYAYFCKINQKISGMNIIIVGATSGIGRELWKLYACGDNRVAVIGRRTTLLEEMEGERPQNTVASTCDISNPTAAIEALDGIFARFDSVDLVFVSAGVGELNPDLQFDVELPTINTNVLGWTAVVDTVYSQFCRQGRGHLVTVTSVGGLSSAPVAPAYSATKAYQINYTNALKKKARKTNIHVTEVRPGLVDTAMAKGEGLFWVMPADKVAKQIRAAVSRRTRTVVVTKRWRTIAFILKYFVD